MKITIAGAGYVGLVAGACYASTGNMVTMVDTNLDRIETLNRGDVPIYEPGLKELLADSIKAERICFTTDLAASCVGADVIGIAVGTPPQDDGSADLSYVRAVAETIGKNITGYCAVVTKSTVPVGTHKIVTDIISQHTDVPFDYVSNPEFLKEGSAIEDFLRPERVIIGTHGQRARNMMEHIYTPFMRQGRRILFMDPVSAELTKYACNSMLATRISFMNEMARLADAVGADVQHVRMGMGSDSRIGRAFLFPGLGYGGSCFPKDVQALIHTGSQLGVDMKVTQAAHLANDTQADVLFDKITRYYNGQLAGKTFGMWGLAFKPRTDDMREAPSLKLIENLLAAGATVQAHDPEAHDTAWSILGDSITYCDNAYQALDNANGLMICTEWMEFRTPDFRRMAEAMNPAVIFDGRNLYEPEYLNDAGIDYFCIGRPDAVVSRSAGATGEGA